jgi:chromosome segregation ATPase
LEKTIRDKNQEAAEFVTTKKKMDADVTRARQAATKLYAENKELKEHLSSVKVEVKKEGVDLQEIVDGKAGDLAAEDAKLEEVEAELAEHKDKLSRALEMLKAAEKEKATGSADMVAKDQRIVAQNELIEALFKLRNIPAATATSDRSSSF